MAKRELGWRELEARHRAAVERKYQRIEMLKALVEEWERREDFGYVRELKIRLRSAEANLLAMKP